MIRVVNSHDENYSSMNALRRDKSRAGMFIAFVVIASLLSVLPIRASAQTFGDVPTNYWAFSFIETLVASGITGGCGSGDYCASDPVTRAQMAVFLERGIRGSAYKPPPATGNVFLDVDSGDFAASFIEQLSADGVTSGCGNNNYCPNDSVTRAQMAVFLLRAKYGANYAPPQAGGTLFADVNDNYWAAAWIEQLAAEGITGGCGGGNYCPEAPVIRDQMAVFLVRTFQIDMDANIVVSGVATDMRLANAGIKATVKHANGTEDEFNTSADGVGAYTLDVDTIAQNDFIVLEATGVGAQQGAKLISLVGSASTLRGPGTVGTVTLDSNDFGSLDITHISTALAVLAERANGGPITTDSELAVAQSRVNGAEMLTMASVIKTVVDNQAVSLPPGISDTLELVTDVTAFEAFLVDLETNFPVELAAAISGTADSLNVGFSVDDVPAVLYAATRDDLPLTGGGYIFQFDVNNSGSVNLFNGHSDTSWSVGPDGEIVVDLLNPPVTEFFPFRDPPGSQVRALLSIDRMTLIRLADGLTSDQVIILTRSVTTFPDNPGLPDEVFSDVPGPENVYLAVSGGELLKFDEGELAGSEFATYYYHENNDSIGLNDPEQGADILTFDANGSGTTARRNFFFQWAVDPAGALVITFANGDATAYARYSDEGEVSHTVALGSLANSGSAKVASAEFIRRDTAVDFAEPVLSDRRYRGLFAVIDPVFPFDYLFQSGGTGCRDSGSAQRLQWESTPENFMDSYLFPSFSPTVPTQRRNWQALTVQPGLLGDRYWVIEHADFPSGDPNYVYVDPLVTPGRINAYEYVEDLAGQFDPCGLGGPGTLTTTFASNNGGTGNMFDVVTNDSAIEITALDVNVAFGGGTQFTLSVYTAPSSFDDTITDDPGCTFNCSFDISAWTLVATGTGSSQGQDMPTSVDIDDFILDANATTGIWVTLVRDGSIVDELRYTNVSSQFGNSDLTISQSAGVTGPTINDPTEGVARNRQWNGTIYYNTR